jgi:hypothetical protein
MKGSNCLTEFTEQPHHFDRTSCSETSKKVSTFYNSIQSAVDGKFQDKLEYFVRGLPIHPEAGQACFPPAGNKIPNDVLWSGHPVQRA